MMVAMAGLQVFIVRFFFQGARKGRPLAVQRDVERGWLMFRRLRMKRLRLCTVQWP